MRRELLREDAAGFRSSPGLRVLPFPDGTPCRRPVPARSGAGLEDIADGETVRSFHSPSGSAQNGLDGFVHALVAREFGFKLLAAAGREAVKANFALGLGDAPFGSHPTLEENLLQGGVERTLLHLQHFFGENVNPLANGIPMQWARAKYAQY